MKIDWAPMNLPLERRLQTLAALFQVFMLLGGQISCLLVILVLLVSLDDRSHWVNLNIAAITMIASNSPSRCLIEYIILSSTYITSERQFAFIFASCVLSSCI